MKIPESSSNISAIKEFFSCRDIFKRYYPDHFMEKGNCFCPFHEDSTPSMQVDKYLAYCHGCGKKYDVIDIYQYANGATRANAIHELAVIAGLETDNSTKEQIRPKNVMDFFKLRGFNENFVKDLMVSGKIQKGIRPDFFNVALTNIDGSPAGFQQIQYSVLENGRKEFAPGTKAKEEAFFHLPGTGETWITESVTDAMSLKQEFPDMNVYSLLSANFADSAKIEKLPGIPVLAFDADKKGFEAAVHAIKRLRGNCRIIDWSVAPCGFKDLNKLLEKGKIDEFKRLVASAKPYSEFQDSGLQSVDALDDEDDSSIQYLPMPPAFPVEVFPVVFQNIIRELAEAFDVPPDVVACPILSFAGAAIGRTRALKLKNGWTEHPNLFMALVGESGIGKSPVSELIKTIIVSFEVRWREEYDRKMVQYSADMAEYKRKIKDGDLDAVLPDKPVLREMIAEDATIEGVGEILKNNPRGINWIRDELIGLLLDLDKYSGKDGSTKSRLLSAFNGTMWKNTRKDSTKNSFIEKALLSIFGTIQEKLLPAVFSQSDSDSGFTPRFLMCRIVKTSPPKWTESSVSEKTLDILKRVFATFLEWDFDSYQKPCIVNMSQEAKEIYVEWFNRQAAEPWVNPDAADDKALLAKNRTYAARLALILHSLESALDGNNGLSDISAANMQGGITLTECFTAHHRQIKRFFLSSNSPSESKKDFDPIQQRVLKSIVALEKEVKQGLLPTARITEESNRDQPEPMHINSRQTGKVIKALGLTTRHSPDKKWRGAVITEKDMKTFKSFLAGTQFNGISQPQKPVLMQQPSACHDSENDSGRCSSCSSWQKSNDSYGICGNTSIKQARFKAPSDHCTYYAGGVSC